MSDQPARRTLFDLALWGVIGLIVLGTLIPVFYFTIFRWADAAICIPRAAQRIGVKATRDAITNYIDEHLTPGIGRGDLMNILKQIGPVTTGGSTKMNVEENSTEVVHLNICKHPMNNISLTLMFTRDGKTLAGFFYGSP